MTFSTRQDQLQYFKQIRSRAARPVGPGVPHGDQCPKLTLGGAEFAIPPRGLRVVPRFDGDDVTIDAGGAEEWLEAEHLLATASVRADETCPSCGRVRRASLEIDLEGQSKFLTLCFSLAAKLLRQHYDLAPQELTELLSFDMDTVPEWIGQLLAWAAGTAIRTVSPAGGAR